ncbi:unnamed protein product [Discula destructiva]
MLIVGSGPSDEEVEAYLKTRIRWNGKCMYEASEHAAWREIPVTYIYTTNDSTVPLAHQQSFVADMEKAGRKVRTFELATGYCPNFTDTDGVVNAIKTIASE